jgi:DNA helicase-2/ATP-dependent DNA helicase PcrA
VTIPLTRAIGSAADSPPLVASPSQRAAIEADAGALLVLAGPGAGKTHCLTERIHFLIEHLHFDPARICAFTFTNKAAGEIAHRLERRLGDAAAKIKRGTIHAFCAELLRELGAHVLLEPGFGIADEEYQLNTLRRIEGPRRWHRNTLTRFSAHRFRGDPLLHDDAILFEQYERFLTKRRLVDFDTLVIKAAELLEREGDAAAVRSRWDVVLVDEFQDLNPVQYRVVHALARDHKHVFAVGDDDQSIYSWAGADPALFKSFLNDFKVVAPIHLETNYRCRRDVFALARTLVSVNEPIFANRIAPETVHEPVFPSKPRLRDGMTTDVMDHRRHHARSHRIRPRLGDVAVLYRTHEIGMASRRRFSTREFLPTRPRTLARRRPVVAYVLAALRVITNPADDLFRTAFFGVVLPRPLFDKGAPRPTRLDNCSAATSTWRRACPEPTKRGARFAARSPIGATSRRSERITRQSRRSYKNSYRVASGAFARCSTTATTKSTIRR